MTTNDEEDKWKFGVSSWSFVSLATNPNDDRNDENFNENGTRSGLFSVIYSTE